MANNPAAYTRALTIAISDAMYEKMTDIKEEKDLSYSQIVRAGLALYFTERERHEAM